MNQRHRSSRIINIALTSTGIKGSHKCRKKLNFVDEPVNPLVMASDPNDGTQIENLGQALNNEYMATAQDYSSVVPLGSVIQNEAQLVDFIPPSPSNDYMELQNSSVIAKVGKEVTAVVNKELPNSSLNANVGEEDTDKEPYQPAFDPSSVDYAVENLNRNFTNSNLTPGIDKPTTSTGLVREVMSHNHENLSSNNLDDGENLAQPSNSMDSDTPHIYTVAKVTETIEIQSYGQNIVKNKGNLRKCRRNVKYIDYMSDHEDFSTFYGDNDDSDDWLKGQSASNEETNDPESTGKTGKKRKNFRRRKPTKNISGTQEETVGDAGLRERKMNERKERSKKKKAGEEYTTKKGETVPAKKVLPNPCQGKKCRYNCGSIPEEKRESIFNHFWKLDTTRRRDWLVSLSQRVGVKRKRSESEKRN